MNKLFQNISDNFSLLKADFTGISISFEGIVLFLLNLLLAVAILTVYYFFGKKLRKTFFPDNKDYTFFINIVFGYITIGTGFLLLGMFSLLRKESIYVYLAIIAVIAFFPFKFNVKKSNSLKPLIKNTVKRNKSFVSLGILLFVGLSFFRLMTPEITEDAYHTDLPRLYLATQTNMHETKDPLHVIPYPQLAEMTYTIPILFGQKETTRFLHFAFYILIILLLVQFAKDKKTSFAKYAPLLFVSTPVVIRYSPTQYVDFFMVLPFILSILLIQKRAANRSIILAGIIFGAALATKVWVLIYFPAFALYIFILNKNQSKIKYIKLVTAFVFAALSVSALWYVRSFIITGNPFFPAFAKFELLETNTIFIPPSSYYFGFNFNMFSLANMIILSPLFFYSAFCLLLRIKKLVTLIKTIPVVLFFLLLMIEQLVVRVDLGRYLLSWYTSATIVASAGINYLSNNKIIKSGFVCIFIVMFIYYFSNTLFLLPYGFGWADRNNYLTRVLGRDNASYYDFDRRFDKHITVDDLVATYGIYGYYYADFSYIDINYIFSKKERSFDLLKKNKVTKLLIKGGNIDWFCKTLSLTKCSKDRVKFLATFPDETRKYNLYSIKK